MTPSELDEIREREDFELVVAALRDELDPERLNVVRQRLEDDRDFRDFAAPLLLAWHVPVRREHLSKEEMERHWHRFTKRAGFIHQKRKARRRWLMFLGALVVALCATAFLLRGRIREWYEDRRDFVDVPRSVEWVALGIGAEVKAAPGARLRVRRTPRDGFVYVKLLRGDAGFRVVATPKPGELIPEMHPLGVITPACVAFTVNGEFDLSVRGDTTEVAVHQTAPRLSIGFITIPPKVTLGNPGDRELVEVRQGRRGRCVSGAKPQLEKPQSEAQP